MTESVTTRPALNEGPGLIAAVPKPQTQEGRILIALGLLRGPLPHAVAKWLMRYYAYLAAHLHLPFEARCPEDSGVLRPWTSNVTVVELVAHCDPAGQDETGLKCRAMRGEETIEIPLIDIEVQSNHPNAQLIEDYWYWFWNWQFDPKI
jgi:hypothetical protein